MEYIISGVLLQVSEQQKLWNNPESGGGEGGGG